MTGRRSESNSAAGRILPDLRSISIRMDRASSKYFFGALRTPRSNTKVRSSSVLANHLSQRSKARASTGDMQIAAMANTTQIRHIGPSLASLDSRRVAQALLAGGVRGHPVDPNARIYACAICACVMNFTRFSTGLLYPYCEVRAARRSGPRCEPVGAVLDAARNQGGRAALVIVVLAVVTGAARLVWPKLLGHQTPDLRASCCRWPHGWP